MRNLKYFLAGLLIISVAKKAYSISIPFTNAANMSMTAALDALKDPRSVQGDYNPDTKTATITLQGKKYVFTGVMLYSQSTTPPNVMNKQMVLFGIMSTPGKRSGGIGASRRFTSLYGIPAATPANIKFYDRSARIAELNDGSIFVCVMEYNQATTPLNLIYPGIGLQAFATTDTPNHTASKLAGAKGSQTTLYGIPVRGSLLLIFDSANYILGWYWPESGIAQLRDGSTFINVTATTSGSSPNQQSASGAAFLKAKQLLNVPVPNTNIVNIGLIALTPSSQPHTLQGERVEYGMVPPVQPNPADQHLRTKVDMVLNAVTAAATNG